MLLARARLGVIPFADGGEARARAFVAALEPVLGLRIELHRAADYRALTSAVEQGLVHFVWLPPLAAARAVKTGMITPVAVAVRHGTTSYMTGLITREQSAVHTVADLKGLRAAWVDRESASGYVVIRAALRERGVSLVDAFAEETFVRSHAEVARALREGKADVGGTCFNYVAGSVEIARSGYNDEGGLAHDSVRILANAGPIPSDVFAARAGVEPAALTVVQQALVDARPAKVRELAMEWMHADGFARPTPAHLRMVEALYGVLDAASHAR